MRTDVVRLTCTYPGALALACSLSACAAPPPGEGDTAYLLLESGAASSVHLNAPGVASGSPARSDLMPIALEPGEHMTIAVGERTRTVEGRARSVGIVDRAGGVAWFDLGGQIETDRLTIEGSEYAAHGLAQMLAATLEPGDPGTWAVHATGIFDRAAFLRPPEGLTAVRPVGVTSPTNLEQFAHVGSAGPLGVAPVAAGGFTVPALDAIGVFSSPGETLFFHVDGTFHAENVCTGDRLYEGAFVPLGDTVTLYYGKNVVELRQEGDTLSGRGTVYQSPVAAAPTAKEEPDSDEQPLEEASKQ